MLHFKRKHGSFPVFPVDSQSGVWKPGAGDDVFVAGFVCGCQAWFQQTPKIDFLVLLSVSSFGLNEHAGSG
jgi:hypothetical protein